MEENPKQIKEFVERFEDLKYKASVVYKPDTKAIYIMSHEILLLKDIVDCAKGLFEISTDRAAIGTTSGKVTFYTRIKLLQEETV